MVPSSIYNITRHIYSTAIQITILPLNYTTNNRGYPPLPKKKKKFVHQQHVLVEHTDMDKGSFMPASSAPLPLFIVYTWVVLNKMNGRSFQLIIDKVWSTVRQVIEKLKGYLWWAKERVHLMA